MQNIFRITSGILAGIC